jgi:hypothetical protein
MKFTSALFCIFSAAALSAAPQSDFLPASCPSVQGDGFAATSLAIDYLGLTTHRVLQAIDGVKTAEARKTELTRARSHLANFKPALADAKVENEQDPVYFRREYIAGTWHIIQWEWASLRSLLATKDEEESSSLTDCMSGKRGCTDTINRFNTILDKLVGFKEALIESDACKEWTQPKAQVDQ